MSISADKILEENSDQPVNLTKVVVHGTEGFSDEFFAKALSPLLGSADLTVLQLANRAQETVAYLNNTECFKAPQITIDQAAKTGDVSTALSGQPIPVEATVRLDPQPLKDFHVGSDHQQLGNVVRAVYTNRSAFGAGQLLKVAGTLNRLEDLPFQAVDVTYKSPIPADPAAKVWAKASIENAHVPAWQSAQQLSTKVGAGVVRQFARGGFTGTVNGGFEATKRSVLEVADSADDEIKTYAGDTTKTSFVVDAKAARMHYLPSSKGTFATHGVKAEVKNEFAGCSQKDPDLFNKLELNSKLTRTFPDQALTLDAELGAGVLTNLHGNTTIHFQDKFYLPLTGYHPLGLTKGSQGGLSYLSYKFTLYSRFFTVNPARPLRAYASYCGGKLADKISGLGAADHSTTASLGLLYKAGESAYCNVGYNWPLKDENAVPGLGISLYLYGDY